MLIFFNISGFKQFNLGYRHECRSSDSYVGGNKKTAMQCAFECRNEAAKKEGKNERDCEFVDHGFYCCDGKKKGDCWHEHGVTCDQSSQQLDDEDNYSLYKLERIRKHHYLFLGFHYTLSQ